MFKSLFLGAALGGITLFLWGAVSWIMMPWHMHAMHEFEDEAPYRSGTHAAGGTA